MYARRVRLLLHGALLPPLIVIAACSSPGKADNDLRREAAGLAGIPAASVDAADTRALRARVDELLAQPLDREGAVKVALLNNPAMVRRFAELRIDAAERVRASRPPNPQLTLARLERGSEREDERGVSIDLLGLLTWPVARGGADRRYEAARQEALQDALALARDTRDAWVDAIAGGDALLHAAAVQEAAETGRLYAERLAAAGSATRLDTARARAFAAEADLALADARLDAAGSREALALLLGLDDPARLQLPAALPPLPASALAQGEAEQRAIDHRVDVQAARRHAEATARAVGIQRATRIVNVLEAGVVSNTSNQAADQNGFEVSLELPLFDLGSAGATEARARHDAALADVVAVANRARSETRLAWLRYQAAYAAAVRHRDEVLPLTADITREMVLRHNGMLVGPFELLAQARAQADATARWQRALRNFWIADAQLAAVLGGAGSDGMTTTIDTPGSAAAPAAGH